MDVTVEESTATLDVAGNGSGRWTARLTLTADSSERLAENRSQLDDIVDDALDSRGETSDVSATLEDRTVVVTYVESDVATRMIGDTLLVDRFHSWGGPPIRFNVDDFAVSGPDGTVVTNDPPGSSSPGDDAARWRAATDHERDEVAFSDDTLVAFGPDAGLGSRVAAAASIGLFVWPTLGKDLLLLATLPAATLLVGLRGLSVAGRFSDSSVSPAAVTAAAVGVGFVLFSGTLVGLRVGLYAGDWSLGSLAAVLLVPSVAVVATDQFTPWRTVGVVAGATALAAVPAVASAPSRWAGSVPVVLPAVTVLPLLLCFGLGRLWDEGGRLWTFLSFVLVATPFFVGFQFVPITGFGFLFVPILFVWSVVALVAGLPFAILGRVVAREGGSGAASST